MSTMANTTLIVTTATKTAKKEKTPKEVDTALKANILDFCEEHYEDILPVIMDKIRRKKRKEVHARLKFRENPKKSRRVREGSQNSSARTLLARYRDPSERPKIQDRLKYNDEDVFDRLGHRRQSAFDQLSNTYSPSTTKSGPNKGSSRDRSHEQGTCMDIMLVTRTTPCSMKRGRENESLLSHVSKSGTNDGGHWKTRAKRCKPVDEEDLSVPWTYEDVDPFTPRIRNFKSSQKTRMPKVARVWFDELPPESIDGYKGLKAGFLAYFMHQKKYVKDPVKIHNIKKRDGETIEEFMERFKIKTGRMKGAPECMRISGFMHGVNNPELTKRLNEHVPKTMEEMMTATTDFIRGETAAASKKKVHTP
nr:hypothetical protein [Tanacetum cinerariifolium]